MLQTKLPVLPLLASDRGVVDLKDLVGDCGGLGVVPTMFAGGVCLVIRSANAFLITLNCFWLSSAMSESL